MSKEDLEINRSVRRVLVRHWLDLGRLFVRSAGGSLSIRGALLRIAGVREDLTPQIVDNIFTEIKRIKNVRRMNIDLENWVYELGVWKHAERRQDSKPPSTLRHTRSHEIKSRLDEDDDENA